jgi:hypothetical protein
MNIEDFQLLGVLVGVYAVTSRACFKFPCPEQLLPKNNKNKKVREYYDYYGCYLSMFHAISSILLTGYALATEGITFNTQTTFTMKLAIYNSLAYFIHDTIMGTICGYLTIPLLVHHIASTIVAGSVFYLQSCGSEVAVGIFLAELSNPFNLSREVLRYFKRDKSKLYFQLSLGFASSFVLARFIVLPFFLAAMYPAATHLSVKIMAGFIWFVSFHWLFVIIGFAMKAFKEAGGDGKDKPNVWLKPYIIFSKIRKNPAFLGAYYLSAAWLSFGTIYLAHGNA